jgi:CRP/FNR family cyclic AMP-dependent transcriptional regulator
MRDITPFSAPRMSMGRRTEPTPLSLLPALQTQLWFASCDPEFQNALVTRSRLWHIKAGDYLFNQGDEKDSLCCVVAGALKLGSTDQTDGTLRLTLYVEPYSWFGEVSAIDGLPRSQDAVADVDSTVMVVTGHALMDWLDAHPRNWRDLARLACGKLRLVLTALEDAATLSTDQRLARRLLMSATNFGQSTQPTIKKRVRLPQDYLARMLGVSRQTINKLLRAMEREGVLALHYGEIEIVDFLRLLQRSGNLDGAQKYLNLPTSAPAASFAPARQD